MRAAWAWVIWALLISKPSEVTPALFEIFCALKGETKMPRFENALQRPVTTVLFPTPEAVPKIAREERRSIRGFMIMASNRIEDSLLILLFVSF